MCASAEAVGGACDIVYQAHVCQQGDYLVNTYPKWSFSRVTLVGDLFGHCTEHYSDRPYTCVVDSTTVAR
jgi:hypothetical protein